MNGIGTEWRGGYILHRRLKPEDLVAAIYEEEGFYEVERKEEGILGASSRIILSDGRRELAVNILDEDALMIHGAIHDALLQAEKLKEKYSGVAIAIPRRFKRAVDEGVLSMHDLGLIVYDMMGAEEVVPPKFAERIEAMEDSGAAIEEKLVNIEEIVKIRSDIGRILRILEELEARLDRLERAQRSLEIRMNMIEQRSSRVEVKVRETPRIRDQARSGSKKLPSYLVDNPWIDILSRRE